MKILYVTLGLPCPPMAGAQIRDFELYRRMAKKHDVRVIALTENPALASEKALLCSSVGAVATAVVPTAINLRLLERAPAHLRRRDSLATLPFVERRALALVRDTAASWQPDIVQIEHSLLASYKDAVMSDSRCKTLLSLHNVGHVQYRNMFKASPPGGARMGLFIKWRLMRRWEAQCAQTFDHVVTVSAQDRDALSVTDSAAVSVVPNGVDLDKRPLPLDPDSANLLFVGNFTYPPNVAAARYFCEAIFPLIRREVPRAHFMAAGLKAPPSLLRLGTQAGVTVVDSPRSLREFYARAGVCVVPLLAGGGTRLKILEAMAYGRPVVSTTLGCEGIDAADGEHLLIADGPEAFAERVLTLLKQRRLAEALARDGRRLVERRYSWDVAANKLDAIYQSLNRRSRIPR